ncbi:MAG TPA: hypothetical protein VE863_17240 [Pyrinomonadaceae bacterium]|jgi:hypothetical protein|nr:hypothetical protein [Pyrinomonadaceae bacterium]
MKILISFALLLCPSPLLMAQTPPTQPGRIIRPRKRAHRPIKRSSAIASNAPPKTSEDFFVGEAKVDVTKDETVVRLAMAQHASVLIELPANDGPRYIIPGDPEMATVDEKALERNKRAIVVRPGTQFLPPQHNAKARNPAATVTAQMRSGLVVTFLFYPVEDLAQNVHRCVLNYNRDEVVARRRAAGLPVNLDDKEQGGEKTTAQSSAALIPIEVERAKESKVEKQASSEPPNSPSPIIDQSKGSNEKRIDSAVDSVVSSTPNNNPEVVATLRSALDQATKRPKQFKSWTHSTHGLKLSILEEPNPSKAFRVLSVAVRNTTTATLKLTPHSPELYVETIDDEGTTVNVHSIAKAQTQSSNTSGDVAAGATVYFAIAYLSPVLDAHQRIKIVIAQTNAVDEPASIKLATSGH